MPPLAFSSNIEDAHRAVLEWLSREARVRVVETDDVYIHAEFTSLFFRFVDDAEFLFEPDQGLVHFRSASRVGYSDLGANRRRMKKFCRDLSKRGFFVSPG